MTIESKNRSVGSGVTFIAIAISALNLPIYLLQAQLPEIVWIVFPLCTLIAPLYVWGSAYVLKPKDDKERKKRLSFVLLGTALFLLSGLIAFGFYFVSSLTSRVVYLCLYVAVASVIGVTIYEVADKTGYIAELGETHKIKKP